MSLDNYRYFKENFDTLYKEYPEKYLLIQEQRVVDDYRSFDEAYRSAISRFEEGTFIIQHCSKKEDKIYFASWNVAF